MPAYADLVHQTSVSTGTGALTLATVNGKRTFLSAFGTGGTNTFDYFISHREAAEWERGTGHEASGTLVRDTVIASSNSNAAVSFAAGLKDVTNDQPADKHADKSYIDTGDAAVVQRSQMLVPHEHLRIRTSSVSALSITADALVLFDSSGAPKRFTSISLTPDIASGGLDTGAEAANTWYFIWVFGKTDGSVTARLSTSQTTPTVPATYTYQGLIGAVRNGSTDLIPMFQAGTVVECNGVALVSSGSAANFTSVTIGAGAPLYAKRVRFMCYLFTTTGTFSGGTGYITGHATAGTTTYLYGLNRISAWLDTAGIAANEWLTVEPGSGLFYYRVTGTNVVLSLTPMGWEW